MLIGYARVSKHEQNLDLQVDALKKAGCERIFTDKVSGVKTTRPGLDEALAYVRPGDSLVVWRLDRLGRRWLTASEIDELDASAPKLRDLRSHVLAKGFRKSRVT